jgi:endonuclease/exonuclease/phosphatase family metal-dependent hydrolase
MFVLHVRRFLLITLLPLLLGLPHYSTMFLPKNTSANQIGESIGILTYNISDTNFRIRELVPWIAEINADIVSLQEVGISWVDRLVAELEPQYPFHAVITIDPKTRSNLTFSRYPILRTETFQEQDILFTQLCVDGHSLAFYNVSLATPIRRVSRRFTGIRVIDYGLNYESQQRDEQFRVLLVRLDAESGLRVLAGDFNFSDQTDAYQELAERMTDSFRSAGMGLGFTWPVAAEFGLPSFVPPMIRIDYIWHSNHFQSQTAIVTQGIGSDHLALISDITITADADRITCDAAQAQLIP